MTRLHLPVQPDHDCDPAQPSRDERGMSTAEYAVGTLAAVTAAGVLVSIFQDPRFFELLWQIIMFILEIFGGLFG
ncbi:DUF4244 domain-containing protein [Parenemella sanctibonifatiensis]|uniref:DUF4244 domain-containing protein n=1 Tax=Parenemella sanctibonifatiensis TaxID=2016505 RepID=A0A255EN45_9ACTN|nr:DUF4244 domain-containing protein [Parenemella sanctibonifatiensis]OYN92640.1 hypothetical protein CGZ91_03980 [Parenemella sanctibonifatiensis]